MVKPNPNFAKFEGQLYAFSGVGREVSEYEKSGIATRPVIRLSIGDAKLPLPDRVSRYMAVAAESLRCRDGFAQEDLDSAAFGEMRRDLHEAGLDKFNGYGDEQGNKLLRERINKTKYGGRWKSSEIFISDGAKCDAANISDLFDPNAFVAMSDPTYPVYQDSLVIKGRTGKKRAQGGYEGLVYLIANEENGFVPDTPHSIERTVGRVELKTDVIWICNPDNPTGVARTGEQLEKFVRYAEKHGALLVHDNAYERFIKTPEIPHSIYDIPGAEKVAIEISSESKEGGLTGVRLGYTIVPEAIAHNLGREHPSLNWDWNKRVATCFNGACNIAQAAGLAIMSPRGQMESQEAVDYYMENARIEREALQSLGLKVYGGIDAPFVWVKTPAGRGSHQFFREVLEKTQVGCTPGNLFGSQGEGFVRFSAFGFREQIEEAAKRLRELRFN